MNYEILEKLKSKRKEIAEREGKKLFMIFHNAVLEKTAEVLPKTKDDLANIKGWGKRKIEKYGDEILVIIGGEKEIASSNNRIFSVQEFISFINSQFSSLGTIKVRGEITEVNLHPNGYCFFTIKDSQTEEHSVSCYISRWKLGSFDHLLEVGMEVVVSVIPSLYKNGRFSLMVNSIEPFGEGALKKAFEALKKKLDAKGYFDESRKRSLPDFIQTIGIMTSETGDAIHDFRKNLGEYGFKIELLDVRVEGDYAEESICSAIKWFNKNKPEIGILVLIRGGGDLENLKAFNSENVAEAIVLSRLPVITGIGHEKDKTIADYVADKNFSTPTATAVFIRTQRENLIAQLEKHSDNLVSITKKIIIAKKDYIIDLFAAGDILHHFQMGRALAHLENLLELLAGIEETKNVNFELLQDHLSPYIKQLSSMIILLGDWDKRRQELCDSIESRGTKIRVLIFRDKPLTIQPDREATVIYTKDKEGLIR